MKLNLVYIFIIMVILFACNNEPKEQSVLIDTLSKQENILNSTGVNDSIIVYDSIATDPFLIKSWDVSLDSVLRYLPADVKITKTIESDQSDPSSNDTVWKIQGGETVFEYRKAPHVGFINYAIISDSFVRFIRDIKIGDTYNSVAGKINALDTQQKIFNKVYINYGDAQSTLIFEFKNNKLYKVIYWPYTG